MRRTSVQVTKRVTNAEIGSWRQANLPSLTYGMVPYIKGREDIEVIYRQPDLLLNPQCMEFSGFGVERILRRVGALELEFGREGIQRDYGTLARVAPPLVSFPPDLVWLGHPKGVKTFHDSIVKTLPASSLAITPENAETIAVRICGALLGSAQKYSFWKELTRRNRETTLPYARLLIEYAITAAARARSRAFAGIVPLVDPETPGSADLAHRMNLATADVVRDRIDDGLQTPPYLYTIGVNSSAILSDTPSPSLSTVIGNVRSALQGELADFFDGVHLSIRGLPRVTLAAGRVNVVMDFLGKLRSVAEFAKVPFWWSRPGVVGLAGRDLGCSISSYSLNLSVDDVYAEGGGNGDISAQCGKVLNPIRRAYWDYHQVLRSLQSPDGGLPEIGAVRSKPTELEMSSPGRYRALFSKPYTVGAFGYLTADWNSSIESGETSPGREYLQTFEAPFNQWGLR